MHRLILMIGTIMASSMGFALAGLILGDTIRNSRRSSTPRRLPKPRHTVATDAFNAALDGLPIRGYDTPELYRDDTRARLKQSGQRRDGDAQ